MTLFNSMIRLQMQLFLLMLCGYAVRKLKVILAQQYGYDAEYAAKVILVSTLASVITIPVLCLFL